MTVAVRTTSEADGHILAASAWWRTNRPSAPELFDHELAGAFRLLASAPDIGRRYRYGRIPGLRRLLLPRTRYHVYYVHDAEGAAAVVLAVWSAVRGRAPALKPA